jgi:hypothetical protein
MDCAGAVSRDGANNRVFSGEDSGEWRLPVVGLDRSKVEGYAGDFSGFGR